MTPLLDLTALIAPIPGEKPAGAPLAGDVLTKMKNARKDSEPHPDDPSKPDVPRKPDWSGIIKMAQDNLTKTSKSLEAAVRLAEALTKQYGFAGLCNGLTLLRMLVVDCWDRIHPLIDEPDDLDRRVGPFQWLSDREGGAWFPGAIGTVPLVKVRGQSANLHDCQNGRVGDQPITADELRLAQPETPTTIEDVAGCVQELATIDQTLNEKMGQQAPSLADLMQVVTECQSLLARLEAPMATESQETSGADPGSPSAPSGRSSRAEMYRQLARLANDLAQLEPHSPIPDLLRWAVKLGEMPFRELIQELVREPVVLADIRRQFGIKEGEAVAPPSE